MVVEIHTRGYSVRMVNRRNQHQCTHCDRDFKNNSTLMIHMRNHTGERPYKCNRCDKSFTINNSLRIHMRKHTGEKPYKCQHCDKSFLQKGTLMYHIRKHTGERPYRCNQCDKGFVQKGHLNVHMRTHMCNNSYTSQNKKSSIAINPGENSKLRVFACFICKETFDNLDICKQHMKTHMESKIPVYSKYGSTGPEITQSKYSRTTHNKNIPNILGVQNDTKDTIDQISIKVEQDIDGDLKQELEDFVEDKGINPLNEGINPSKKDFQKIKMVDTRETVSIKVEQDSLKDISEHDGLYYVDVKVDEDDFLNASCLVKQEIMDNNSNSN